MSTPRSKAAPTAAVVLGLVVVLALAAATAMARSAPSLSTSGPTAVNGTEATAVFKIADRTLRQIRYADQGTLRYTFVVHNNGAVAVTVLGLGRAQPTAKLFRYVDLRGSNGDREVKVVAGGTAKLTLSIKMSGCETLSARSGSFATEVVARTRQAGLFTDEVTLTLPEEVHTGSPREAFCPNASATSRPQG